MREVYESDTKKNVSIVLTNQDGPTSLWEVYSFLGVGGVGLMSPKERNE